MTGQDGACRAARGNADCCGPATGLLRSGLFRPAVPQQHPGSRQRSRCHACPDVLAQQPTSLHYLRSRHCAMALLKTLPADKRRCHAALDRQWCIRAGAKVLCWVYYVTAAPARACIPACSCRRVHRWRQQRGDVDKGVWRGSECPGADLCRGGVRSHHCGFTMRRNVLNVFLCCL